MPLRIIIDSDANNELDDQHALAYALLSPETFRVEGITVNRTRHGGDIDAHAAEAERIVRLCGRTDVPVIRGASGALEDILEDVQAEDFDGSEAVQFIVERAEADAGGPLVLLPIGKLTNIALALARAPHIADSVRVVWLGSNYPEPGEYNEDNDLSAVQYVLDSSVPFEIALVRYGDSTGTDAVRVTPEEVRREMPGAGPVVSPAIVGRDGREYRTIGDYSVGLFDGVDLYGDPPSRALFDMAAVAIVKNPSWARKREIPAPRLASGRWIERPDNDRTILLWEEFDRDAIVDDFFATLHREPSR